MSDIVNPASLSRLRIEALELYGESLSSDVYLQLSPNKYVKVVSGGEGCQATLAKYKTKGVQFVYLDKANFDLFANSVRALLQKKMMEQAEKHNDDPSEKARILSSAHDILKNILAGGRMDEETRALANEVTRETVKLVSRTKIIDRFKEFKKNCSDEYLHATATCFVSCCLIDTFNWPSSDQIKEKVVLGALLCDVTLCPEDFLKMKEAKGDKEKLSPKILNHPYECAEIASKDSVFISPETLAIIKQHHERPNGKGFPKGLGHQSITALTSVYIIANSFVERMYDENYVDEHKEERMHNIVAGMRERYSVGTFKKSYDALTKCFGPST